MKVVNFPNLVIGIYVLISNLVLTLRNPEDNLDKAEALKYVRRTTEKPYSGKFPTAAPTPESPVRRDQRTEYRRYSWEFAEPNDSPWTGFLFTLAPKTCELANYCGAIIVNKDTLLTSCACVRTYFRKFGFDGEGSNFDIPERGFSGLSMDLSELPIYVFHAYYRTLWSEKTLTHDWPWKLYPGKGFRYLKQNYHCWQAFMSKNCSVSGTRREPWDRKKCGVSTVAVLGIAPSIEYMPKMPWPPVPILYEMKGAELKKVRNGYFWEMPYAVPVFDKVGFSLTSYFLRLVNDTNYVKNDIGEVVYLPQSLIVMDFALTNQSQCIEKDWFRYYSLSAVDKPPWPFKSDVSCLMARDPLMIEAYRRAWKPAIEDLTTESDASRPKDTWRNNIRVCGSEVGFPVWTPHGLHGMTVGMIDCDQRPIKALNAMAIPFTSQLITYIEAIENSFVEQEIFEHLQYDVPKFNFNIVNEGNDQNLDFYINKPRSSTATHRFSIFHYLFVICSTFFK